MYKIKNLAEKTLNKDLLEEFLGFANNKLEIDQPYSVYFVDDKQNAADPLGKTAMYNPSSNSVYVYATNRHPKDILRSIAHELMHHKQNCDGRLDKTYGEDSDDLKTLELEANKAGYLVREFEDGRKSQKLFELWDPVARSDATVARREEEERADRKLADAIKAIENNQNYTVTQKNHLIRQLKEKRYPPLELEKIVDMLDVIGIFPGLGDVIDLANAPFKALLAYEYSFGPKKDEKFNFPFGLGSIDMSTFYMIDTIISLLSAVQIGEPFKLAMLALKRGTLTIQEAYTFSKFSLIYIKKIQGAPNHIFWKIMDKTGANPVLVKNKLAEIAVQLEKVERRAETLMKIKSVKNMAGTAAELTYNIERLNADDALEFIMGNSNLAKKLGINPVDISPFLKSVEDAAILVQVEKTVERAKILQDPAKFGETIEDLFGRQLPLDAIKKLDTMPDQAKMIFMDIFNQMETSALRSGQLDQIRDNVLEPLAQIAKKGTIPKEEISKSIKKTIEEMEKIGQHRAVAHLQNIEKIDPDYFSRIDWSKGVDALTDFAKQRQLLAFQSGELALAAKQILGNSELVKKTLTNANKEVNQVLEVIENLRKNTNHYEKASAAEKTIYENALKVMENGDDWAKSIYQKHMQKLQGELLSSGSKLADELAGAVAKRAEDFAIPFFGAPGRYAAKASGKIAKLTSKNPYVVAKFINYFVAILNRNFFGKTYISNTFIVNGKIMNGAAAILDKYGFIRTSKVAKALALTPDGLAARVSSAFMASAMFYWLRVLENEELAGGGGNPNVGKEQKGMKGDAEVAEEAAGLTAPIAVALAAEEKEPEDGEPETVGLGEAATQTAAKLREEAKKTTNPALKEFIDGVQRELDKLAKELQTAQNKQAMEEAKKKAAAALAAKAAAAQKAAEEKLKQTHKESPSVNNVPPGAAAAANADTEEANNATEDATQQVAKDVGLGGSGSGGGAGGGKGPGTGPGTSTDYGTIRDAVNNRKYNDVKNIMDEELFNYLKKASQYKRYEIITNIVGKYNKEKKQITKNDLDDLKLEESINNLADYREKVLNERFNKLVKGFTK